MPLTMAAHPASKLCLGKEKSAGPVSKKREGFIFLSQPPSRQSRYKCLHFIRACVFLSISFTLECSLTVGAFAPLPTKLFRKCRLGVRTILRDAPEKQGDDDAQGEKQNGFNIFSNIKSATGEAASRVKELAEKGSSGALSAANATTCRIADLTGRGTSGVKSAAGAVSSSLSDIAGKGSSDVLSVASSATFGLINMAEKGTSGVKSAAGAASSSLSEIAGKGASDVRSVASSATSGLINMAEKGTSDVSSVTNATASSLTGFTKKGASNVRNVASSATSGLIDMAEKGTSDVSSVASAAASSLTGFTKKGASNVRNVASSATSGFIDMAEKGTSDVGSVASAAASSLTGFTKKGASNVRNAAGTTTSQIKKIAKSSTYNAGEVVRWIDTQAKDGASATNIRAKSLVLRFTGKKEYRFGDVTKELIQRTASEEYNIQDILLLLKVLLTVGVTFGPLAKILPVTVLLEALNMSLEKQVGGKLLEALAALLDERFSAAFTGDDKFQLGDLTKRTVTGAILNFTGKDSYESGDIERAVILEEKKKVNQDHDPENINTVQKTLKLRVGPEFEEWDRVFRDSHSDLDLTIAESLGASCGNNSGIEFNAKAIDMKIASELEEWDQMFREKYSDCES